MTGEILLEAMATAFLNDGTKVPAWRHPQAERWVFYYKGTHVDAGLTAEYPRTGQRIIDVPFREVVRYKLGREWCHPLDVERWDGFEKMGEHMKLNEDEQLLCQVNPRGEERHGQYQDKGW